MKFPWKNFGYIKKNIFFKTNFNFQCWITFGLNNRKVVAFPVDSSNLPYGMGYHIWELICSIIFQIFRESTLVNFISRPTKKKRCCRVPSRHQLSASGNPESFLRNFMLSHLPVALNSHVSWNPSARIDFRYFPKLLQAI